MNTFISPNIKKTSEMINPNGDVIDKKTRQVIEPNIEDVIPVSATETPSVESKMPPTSNGIADKIESMVQAKLNARIEEMVEKKVADILSNM